MITVFLGDNAPAREQSAKEFIGVFAGVHGSSAIDRFNGDSLDIAQLKDSLATIPFLSSKRMVIIRDLSSNKNVSDKFSELNESLAETTELVIIENHLDSRSKLLNELKKHAEIKEFGHLEGEELIKWILEQTDALEGDIKREDALFLVERVGTNHQQLANELAKLVLYNPSINKESINLMTTFTPQSSVFTMLDSAFSDQISKALKLYSEQRDQGMEPQAILGMIAWQLNILATVKSAADMSPQQIASESKINPFVIRKNQAIARKISKQKLIKMLDSAIEADRKLKFTSVNADDVLQTLLISFK